MKIKIVILLLTVLSLLWFLSWFVPILIPMNKKSVSGVAQITNSGYYDSLSLSTVLVELKNIGKKFLTAMPGLIKRVWLDFYSLLVRLWGYIKSIWFSYIQPFLENIWFKIKNPLSSEVEERKSLVKEEFKSEKESLIKEVKDFFSKINIPFKGVIEKIIK